MDLNMTPMIDCVFQLIIFFIVCSEIARVDRIDSITLPIADQAKPENRAQASRLIISVDKGSKIYIAGQTRSMDQVVKYLKIERSERGVAHDAKTAQPILIQADEHATWQTVQDIIEKANENKFWRIAFSAKKEES